MTQWRNMVSVTREHPGLADACAEGGPLSRVAVLAKKIAAVKSVTLEALVTLGEHGMDEDNCGYYD